MPADITGTDIIQEDPTTGHRRFVFQQGPIFTQMLLADEINRTPPKTQAALLEAMQEHSVTVGGHTLKLEEPFFVLATQNPIEQEGTYPLPEAQKDRFIFLVKSITRTGSTSGRSSRGRLAPFTRISSQVINGYQIQQLQKVVRKVPVPDHVMDFVLDLVRYTRPNNPKRRFREGSRRLGCRSACVPESGARSESARGAERTLPRHDRRYRGAGAAGVAASRGRHLQRGSEGMKIDDIITRHRETVPRGEAKQAL
jgi:MoxR-like ATPase